MGKVKSRRDKNRAPRGKIAAPLFRRAAPRDRNHAPRLQNGALREKTAHGAKIIARRAPCPKAVLKQKERETR